ncbi:hypothetical protein NDU88_000702 [Pleurodeles waltl]|uniref:Alpha-2-macroglobulin-like protein 1 n=1 Tax=Pleurodeles waltl TaxID=8319 RepID=A0AAV7P4Z3_PLEWA|nr:hypothetical protein NDU88_000702 [Pleurodeles waltl]
MWAVLLSSALLVLRTTSADMRYLVFTAPIFKSNQTGKVCLEVIGISEPTDMKVTLRIPNIAYNISFFDEILPAGEFRQCREMPIPSLYFPTLATLAVISGNRSDQRNVVVNSVKPFCVGQMEKQIYKPGETMRCRITCLNGNLLPDPQTVKTFEVSDPFGNILMRETNVEMKNTFAVFSYRIPSEPSKGYYQLRATMAFETVYLSCEVKHYVLPTFDADLKTPSTISIIDQTMDISVSGSYTYGKSLGARAEISVSRRPNQWSPAETCNLNPNGIRLFFSGYLNPDGALNVTVNLQEFQLTQRGLQDSLYVEATITENGTGVQVFKKANVYISRLMQTPYFNYQATDKCYRQGLNVTGSLILRSGDKGIRGQSIALYVASENVANCVTDENGDCSFSFDTSKYATGSLVLEARYDQNRQCFDSSPSWTGRPINYPQLTIQRCYSPSGSFLKVWPVEGEQRCGQPVTIKGDVILNRTSLLPNTNNVTATYKVMAQAEIELDGEVIVTLDNDGKGSFSLTITVDVDLAPTATALATILMPSGEVVGHHTTFEVQRCFQNKVNVTFSPEKARPGSNVSITIQAAPGSHCAICAKDASVGILSPDYGLSWGDQVYNRIPYRHVSGSWIDGFSLTQSQYSPCKDMPDIVLGGVNYQATADVNYAVDWQEDMLNSFGLITFCNGCTQKPNVCPKPNNCQPTSSPTAWPVPLGTNAMFTTTFASGVGSTLADRVISSVRQNFPESWLCDVVEVNSDGKAVMVETVPDTITEWVADVPCNSETSGFGALDEPKGFKAFQEFFVDVTISPTFIRGEEVILEITAFNYMPECVRVDLGVAPSEDYSAQLISVENEFCICERQRTTASYNFRAVALGTIDVKVTAQTNPNNKCSGATSDIQYRDTVIKTLVVNAEGLPREETQGALLCSKDGPVSHSVNVVPHPAVVNDSARIIVSCVGDPIGISAQYSNDLLQMPIGGGEQTLSMLLANLHVRKYLNITGKLDQALKVKSDYYIANGVGNTMNFLSYQGCLSTWPNTFTANFWTQTSCSLWLTSLGLVTLTAAKDYTFVDEARLNQLQGWISSQQDQVTGAFHTDGNSFNQIPESDITPSAYTTIGLLESGYAGSSVVVRCLEFLDTQVHSLATPLEMAMVSYAYILANKTDVAKSILVKLEAYEITDDDGVHLKDPNDQTSGDTFFFPWSCNSVTNLQNAYYALCLLHSDADSNKLLQIIRFLVKRMNGHGGFCTSQDTAPALQAVIELLSRVYNRDGTNTVDVQSGSTSIAKFSMNPSNSLVLQQTDTLPLPGSYVLEVTGNACVFCQTTVKYNIKPENMKQTFNVEVKASPETCGNGDLKKIDLNITMSYAGQNNASNMALLDVQLLSGFQVVESNLIELENQGRINRYDLATMGHVIIYFKRITKEPGTVAFTIIEKTSVKNRKMATVHIFDFYKRDELGSASYAHPCSQPQAEGMPPRLQPQYSAKKSKVTNPKSKKPQKMKNP